MQGGLFMQLNGKTLKVMESIKSWFEENNRPPTLRELAKEAGYSSTWPLRYHLKKLSEAGYIDMKKNLSRGMELLKPVYGIPMVGAISAGRPITAAENIEYRIDSVAEMFGVKNTFALRVKGDSMTGAGIFNGDTVIIKQQKTAENGDIVAALLGSEATVKKFFMTPEGIKLEPANPAYDPIVSKEIRILGRVVGVLRKLP
jgi:repressor LexA